jgi:FMN reductase
LPPEPNPNPDTLVSQSETSVQTQLRVVLGSTTPPGRVHRAIDGAIERGAERGIEADLIDLGTLDLGFANGTPPADLEDDTAATIAAIENARAVIFATPIYRGSLSGSLKNLIDLTPVPALQAKVVGIVAMGASDHHFLGAERHLRDVLTFFGAVVMPVAVYLNGTDFTDGVPGERAETVLDQLFTGVAATAAALEGVDAVAEPLPLGAKAVKPRTGATG